MWSNSPPLCNVHNDFEDHLDVFLLLVRKYYQMHQDIYKKYVYRHSENKLDKIYIHSSIEKYLMVFCKLDTYTLLIYTYTK